MMTPPAFATKITGLSIGCLDQDQSGSARTTLDFLIVDA
jgi:hypothetical protein